MLEVWVLLTVAYLVGTIVCSLLLMIGFDNRLHFSWNSLAWGAVWPFVVFVYAPMCFVRDLWDDATNSERHRVDVE